MIILKNPGDKETRKRGQRQHRLKVLGLHLEQARAPRFTPSFERTDVGEGCSVERGGVYLLRVCTGGSKESFQVGAVLRFLAVGRSKTCFMPPAWLA